METALFKFRDPRAVYAVDKQFVEFIRDIPDARVRQIFAAALGEWTGEEEARKNCERVKGYSVYDLTRNLTLRRQEILRRKYVQLTKLPTAIVRLIASKEMVGFSSSGERVFGYGDYTVGVGFVEYMQANLQLSIFKDHFKVYLDEAVEPPRAHIEITKQYAGLLDLGGYLHY
jgi:hypothetical protein